MKLEILERVENLTSSIEEISYAKDTIEVCNKIESLLKDLTQSDFGSLFVFDKEKQMLYKKGNQMLELSMVEVEGCIGRVYFKKEPAIYNYLTSDKDYISAYDNPYNHKLKSQMLMPILEKDNLVGIVRVSRAIGRDSKHYTKNDMEALASLESYLIKIIRTIHTNAALPSCQIETENIQHKFEESRHEEQTNSDEDMLLFLSNTVHDIRTPANSLYGFLELLEEQIEDKRLKEFVINAKESAGFINALTDSILAKSKNRYEGSTSKPMEVNTIKFLSESMNIFAARMFEKKINYYIHIDPTIPKEIKVDTLKLKRVLINLIGNAYKFTPNEHSIEVNIVYNTKKKTISVSVKDTGIGIAEEDQKKLFKAFSQATEDTQEKYGGTGLGLAISAAYVSEMGGELKLKSRINEGTEFYFDIPLDVVNLTESHEKFINLNKKIVILSDDINMVSARYIHSYLKKLGMPEDKIHISKKLKKGMTHLICFENKITPELIAYVKENHIELLLIEETLFSLLNNTELKHYNIVSENTYYEDAIHSTIFSAKKVKVMIVDDNKINLSLLESMLATEYIEIDSYIDAKDALKVLKTTAKEGTPYDVIYLDEHMPEILGTELLSEYRGYEKIHNLKRIYAVSISGDPYIDEEDKNLFDVFVSKPFSKNDVRDVIKEYGL